jgi:GAF domain-containing protein
LIRLAELFGKVARALAGEGDVQATLRMIVVLAVDTVESCEFAGISFVAERAITSPASSGDIPGIVDAIQAQVGEGPCMDAIREHEVVQTGDLAAESRWPQFATRAHDETGVQSILSVRLFLEEHTLGALNLYARSKNAFATSDVAMALVFAAHAAVALSSAARHQDLERKAMTRDLIGRAKGILIERNAVSDEQAFELLKQASQRLNIKVTAVAQQLSSGDEPNSGEAE